MTLQKITSECAEIADLRSMQNLVNKNGETVGYLYNNILLLRGNKVAGVLLGHCIYARTGKIIGKFLHQALYDDNGNVVARQGGPVSAGIDAVTDKLFMQEVWEIMGRSHNHVGPWIEPSEKWSRRSLDKFLSQ